MEQMEKRSNISLAEFRGKKVPERVDLFDLRIGDSFMAYMPEVGSEIKHRFKVVAISRYIFVGECEWLGQTIRTSFCKDDYRRGYDFCRVQKI